MAEKLALVERYLSCHVCSETFRDPVTLRCNHSLCSNCLKDFWDETECKYCPVCNRRSSMDDSDVNFILKELADSYSGRLKLDLSEDEVKVLCCEHPGEHKLFCEEEQRAVCIVCDFPHRRGHRLLPIEQAVANLKDQMKSDLKTLKDKRNKYKKVAKKYNTVVPHNKKQVVNTERQIRGEYDNIHRFLREEEEAILAALREEEEHKGKIVIGEMKMIQEQISSLSKSISAVEQDLQKDTVSFLSSYKHTQTSTRVQCTLSDPQLVSGALIDVAKHLENLTFKVWDKMKERAKFTPVILDPNTAEYSLCISEDLTGVRHTDKKQQLPDNPERFTNIAGVLGTEGFSSGQHHWDVDVGDHPEWVIGVAQETVDRKGVKYCPPNHGIWCLSQKDGKYNNGWGESVPVWRNPDRIRVELDYDRGKVSFYDADEAKAHIYTHRDTFMEKLYPFFSIGPSGGDAKTIDVKVCQKEMCLLM